MPFSSAGLFSCLPSALASTPKAEVSLTRSSRIRMRFWSGLCAALAMGASSATLPLPVARAQDDAASNSSFFGMQDTPAISRSSKNKGNSTRILGVTEGNKLLAVDVVVKTDRRSRVTRTIRNAGSVQIKGLVRDESIVGIDFRPATGELYGVGNSNQLYVINTDTGVATPRGSVFGTPLNGTKFGVDFNPLRDRLRVQSEYGQNLRIEPVSGTTIVDSALAYAADDDKAGRTPQIVESAYLNSFPGAATTALYAIDAGTDSLVIQDPPNAGTLQTVGSLGFDIANMCGFDIAPGDNTAYAALSVFGSGRSQLYTIDLETGAATLIGKFGRERNTIRGLTVVPSTPTNPLPGIVDPTPTPTPTPDPNATPTPTPTPTATPRPRPTPFPFPFDPVVPVPSVGPSRIVFVSTRDGNEEIYSAEQSGGNVTRLTFSTASDRDPFISADGTKIVFSTNRDAAPADVASKKPEGYEIYIMNFDGSLPTRITNNVFNDRAPTLSADDTKVAFVSKRVPVAAPVTPGTPAPPAVGANEDIYLMNQDGSGETRVTSDPESDFDPSFRPDGNRIVYAGTRGAGFGIFSIKPDGTGVATLTSGTAAAIQPVYSPSGNQIAYASTLDSTKLEIYTMDSDGTNVTRLTRNTVDDSHPAWNPEGSRIACETFGGAAPVPVMPVQTTVNVFVMNAADGAAYGPLFSVSSGTNSFQPSWGQLATVVTPPATPAPGTPGAPGTAATDRIVFSALSPGAERDIYAISPLGTNLVRLTTSPGADLEADASRDGKKIAFVSNRERATPDPRNGDRTAFEIYVMNSDGTNQVRLTTSAGEDSHPSISADGSTIVFESRRDITQTNTGRSLYVIKSDASGLAKLTTTGDSFEPSISPDGTKVVYSQGGTGGIAINVLDLKTNVSTQLASPSSIAGQPVFSADGSKVAFVSNRDGAADLYVVAVGGTTPPVRVVTGTGGLNPTWSPDGTTLAYDSAFALFTIKADGTSKAPVAFTGPTEPYDPSWTIAPPTTVPPITAP